MEKMNNNRDVKQRQQSNATRKKPTRSILKTVLVPGEDQEVNGFLITFASHDNAAVVGRKWRSSTTRRTPQKDPWPW